MWTLCTFHMKWSPSLRRNDIVWSLQRNFLLSLLEQLRNVTQLLLQHWHSYADFIKIFLHYDFVTCLRANMDEPEDLLIKITFQMKITNKSIKLEMQKLKWYEKPCIQSRTSSGNPIRQSFPNFSANEPLSRE